MGYKKQGAKNRVIVFQKEKRLILNFTTEMTLSYNHESLIEWHSALCPCIILSMSFFCIYYCPCLRQFWLVSTPLGNELLCHLFRALRYQWILLSANLKVWHPWQMKKIKFWELPVKQNCQSRQFTQKMGQIG